MRHYLFLFLWLAATSAMAQHHQFDATNPDVHDPVMAQGEDGRYYIFSTGMGIGVMSSADLKTWRQEPGIFHVSFPGHEVNEDPLHHPEVPQWAVDSVPKFRGHIWAPDIAYINNRWMMFYSCSSFGVNGSAIGVATSKSLDPKSPDYGWKDLGPVVVSHRNVDNWNAIDPNYIDGHLFWGSFWDGIMTHPCPPVREGELYVPTIKNSLPSQKGWGGSIVARRMAPGEKAPVTSDDDDMKGDNGEKIVVEAGENAIEAPFCIKRDGWYYLFVSWDYCCRGERSTYKTVYGRSRNVEGPYLDKEGKDMRLGGGTLLVGPDSRFYGIGHNSAYEVNMPDGTKEWLFISHAYDTEANGRAKLFMRKMVFDEEGWIGLAPLEVKE